VVENQIVPNSLTVSVALGGGPAGEGGRQAKNGIPNTYRFVVMVVV
jgi:hypothetical protein